MNIETAATARRPGRPKSEEKAHAIREAASELFMTVGLGQTSMDAISQAAGVSKQTVYSHFHSKDDLFRACVACKVQHYGIDESQIDTRLPVATALRQVGKQFLTLLSDPEVIQMFRLMIAQSTAFPLLVQSFRETGPLATIAYVTQVFANYLDLTPDDQVAQQAAAEFIALLKGDFFIEQLLGTRQGIGESEMIAHVDHCVTQIRALYAL